jgi:predicted outer membrane lipoprotein
LRIQVRNPNAKGVRQFQPRVALWQPWDHRCDFMKDATPTKVGVAKNLLAHFRTQGFKANPGLKLANAFSVIPSTQGFKANPGLKLANAFSVIPSTQGFKANPGLKLANAFSVISMNLPNAFIVSRILT